MALTDADFDELIAIRRRLSVFAFELTSLNLRRALAKAYNPGQSRTPPGYGRESGRWTSDVGARDPTDEQSTADERPIQLAAGKGGIPRALWNLTVRQFVSQYCKGTINRELPGEFEGMTIANILELRQGGDAAAKKCFKLLNQPRFRK